MPITTTMIKALSWMLLSDAWSAVLELLRVAMGLAGRFSYTASDERALWAGMGRFRGM